MAKRIADWLEKFSVLSAGIGIFQGNAAAVVLAIASMAGSLWITRRIGE